MLVRASEAYVGAAFDGRRLVRGRATSALVRDDPATPVPAGDPSISQVLSTQRSGTHFIMAELRRHPQVFAFEEAFYEHEVPRDPAKFEKGLRVFFGLDDYEHGALYHGLDTPLKKRSADAMAARGLVVHYNQAVDWDHFAEIAKKLELRVVHLERKDARRTAVSEFLNHGDADCLSEHHKKKVAAKARRIADLKKTWRDRLRQQRFPSLDVVYEELVADADGELRRIFEFLGTPRAEMHDFHAGGQASDLLLGPTGQ